MISTFILFRNLRVKLFFIIFFSAFIGYVNAQVAGGTATANPSTICSGQTTIIKLTGQIGTHIKWQRDSLNTFVFIYPLRTSDTLLTPALTAPSKYRAVVSTLDLLLHDTSTVATVAIAPFSVGGTIAVSNTGICGGQSVTVKLNGDQVGDVQWQLDTAGTFVDIPGAVSSPYNTPPLNKTTTFRAKITSSSCTPDFSDTKQVTVTPASSGGMVKADTTVVCSGTATNLKATGYVGTSFQWQIDTTGTFANISGATGTSYATPPLTRVTKYRLEVTNGNCASAYSNPVEISTAPSSVGGEASPDTAICAGNSVTMRLKNHHGSIQWQIDTSGAFVAISGATSATYPTFALNKESKFRAMVTSGNCPPAYSTVATVSINAKTDPGIASADTTFLCNGNSTTLHLTGTSSGANIQWQSKTTGAFTNIPGATQNIISTGNIAVTTSFQALVEKHGCTAISNSVTITVNPLPTAGTAAAANPTLCSNNSTNITLSGASNGASIQWQSKTTGAYSNIPGATNATYNSGNLTTTTHYQAIVTLNNCSVISNEVTVTVNPGATPGTAAATASTLCSGNGTDITLTGASNGATIQWQSKTTGAFADINGATNATYNTGNLTTTTTYQAVVTLNSCTATSNAVTVTVNPLPTAGTAAAANPTLCSNNSTDITLSGASNGASIQWQSKTTGAYANIPGATNATYNSGNLTTTTHYQAIVTLNNCSVISNEVTVTVNPGATPGTAAATASTLCSGNGTDITLTGASNGATIQWQSKTTGAFADINGATNATYNTGNLTTTTTYQAMVTLNSCTATSNAVTVTVNPLPTAGTAAAANPTLCSNNSTDIILSGASNGATIQWQSKTTGAFADINGANSATLNTGNLSTTTSYQAVVTLNSCTAISNAVTVTVNPLPTAGTAAAANPTLCSNNSTDITLSGASNGASIQWQSKTTGAYANIPGATNATYNSGNLTTTTHYQAIVTLNNCSVISNEVTVTVNPGATPGTAAATASTLCSGNGTDITLTGASNGATIQWQSKTTGAFADINGATNATYNTGNLTTSTTYQAVVTLSTCTATSNPVTVTVNAIPDPGTANAASSTLCSGNSTTITLTGTASGATIQWQSKTTGAFTDINGANSATLNTGNLSTTTSYQAVVTLNSCTAISNAVTVTVNTAPTPGSASAASSTLCNGNATVITLSGTTSGASIQWQSKTTGAFADITGANGSTYNTGNLNTTTTYQAVVTQNGCSVTSNPTTVTVNTTPNAGTITAGSTALCSGNSTLLTLGGTTSGATIQWQRKTTGAYSDISGANGSTYNTGSLNTTTHYQAVVINNGCTATSNEVTITVNPTPSAGNASAANSPICSGSETTITLAGMSTGVSIQWQSKTTGAFSDINGANNPSYLTGNLTTTTTYQAVVTLNGCTAISNPVTVTINPIPTAGTASSTLSTICSGSGTDLNLTGASAGATIQWQLYSNGSFSDIPNATSTTYSTGNLTSTTTYQAVVTLNGCSTQSNSVTITVNPGSSAGTISASSTDICEGDSTIIRLTGSSGAIQWQSKTTGSFSDIANATGTEYHTPGLTTIITYRALVGSNNCISISDPITITVHPKPVGGNITPAHATICTGKQITLTLKNYSGQIQWQTDASGSYADIPQENGTTYNTPILTATTHYKAILKSTGCAVVSSAIATVTIAPVSKGGTVTATPSTICSNQTTTIKLTDFVGTSIQWQKKVSGGSYTDIADGLNDSIFTTPQLTSNTYYRALVKNSNCAEVPSDNEALVTIAPTSEGGSAVADSSTICSGTGTAIRLKNYVGTIQWQSDASGSFADIANATSDVYTITSLTKTTSYKAIVKSNNCPQDESNTVKITIAPPSVGGSITTTSDNICSGATTKLTLSGYTGTDIKWQKRESGSFVTIPGATGPEYVTPPLYDDTEYQAVVTNGHCTSAISTKKLITIIPALDPGVVKADQSSVCSGTFTYIRLTGATGSYQWQTDNGGGTFTDISGAVNAPYQTPNLTVATSYRAVVSGGSCASVTSQAITVGINPPSKGGKISATKTTVCSGTNTSLTLNNYDGTIDWQVDDGSGSFVDITGTGAHLTTYTTPNLTKQMRYRAKVTRAGCASAYSDPITIDIAPASVAGTISASATVICPNNSVTLTLTGSAGSIQWQSDTTGSFTNIPSANSATYTTFPVTKKTIFKAVVTNGGCTPASASIEISIAPALSGGNTIAIPSTVCKGNSTILHVRNYTGNIQWQTNETGSFIDIPNATDTVYTTPNLTVDTKYRVVVSSGNCPIAISTETTVSVIPASEGGTVTPANVTICGGTSTILTLSGNVGSIQWQSDASGSFTDITGATASTFGTGALTKNTSFRAVVTSAGCASVNSSVAFVSITPASKAGTASAAQPSICSGGTATVTLTGYVGTQIQWQWDGTGGGYTDISGATGSSYSTTLTQVTHFRARVKNGSCSTVTSNVVTISITPALKAGTAQATPSSVCYGTTTTIKLTGHTGSQIQWQTNAGGPYADIPNATDSVFITPALTAPTNYRALVNGSGCPQVISTVASVTIIPLSVGGTISANPSTICSGQTSALTLSGYTGNIQWQSDETGSFQDIPNATGATYTTPALNASTSYRAIVTSGSCSPEKSTTTLVTVVPSSASGLAKATPATVCNGGSSKITLTGYVGDKFQWQIDAAGNGTFTNIPGATSSEYITPALTNNTSYRVIVTNGSCAASISNPVEVKITPVLNGGNASAVQSAICKGTFATIKLVGQSGSIQWQASVSGPSGPFKDIPGAYSNTLITSNLTVATSFRAVLSSGGCAPVYSNVVDISIIPASVGGVASAKRLTVCSGEKDTVTLNGHTGSIQWQIDTNGVYVDIPGATGSFYETPPLTLSSKFRAVVTSSGCAPANSAEVFVTVAPASKAGVATATAIKICSGATTTLNLNGYIGAIHWQSDESTTFKDIPGATGMTYTTGPLTTATNFRAMVSNGSCPAVPSNVLAITITPALSGGTTSANPSTICKGTTSTLTLKDHSGAVRWQTYVLGSWVDIDTVNAIDTFYVTPALSQPTTYRAMVSSKGCASATSTPVTVSVSPASTAGSAVAAPSSICSGETTTINLSGYTGTIQWQINESGSFIDVAGATGSSFKTPALLKTTSFRAIVTNASCAPDTSTIAVVSIIPQAVGGIPEALAPTVCTGGTTTINLKKYTGSDIQWQRDSANTFVDIKGAIGASYSTPPLAVPTTYRAKVNTGKCPFAVSSPITIQVTDELEGGMATVIPSTVCNGATTTLNLANYKGSIQWQHDSPTGFVDIPGANSTPYTTATVTAQTRFLAVVSSGNCPTVYSNIVTAYVTPKLSAGVITATPSTICSGETTKLKISGHTGNVQWQEYSSGTFTDIPGQTADTCRVSVLLKSTWFRAKVSSGSCTPVTTDSVMINVNVVATPTGDTVQQFCSITNPTVADLKVDTTPDVIKWYSVPTGGTALPVTTALINDAFYYATRSALGCESYKRFKVKVTVFKSATVSTQPKNVTTCPGLNAVYNVKGEGTSLTYKWMVDETGTGTNYKFISDNLTYKGTATDTLKVLNVNNSMNGYSFKCVVKGNCSLSDTTKSEGAALIISPNTTVTQQPVSIAMCYNDAAIFNVNATGSALSYQWQVDSTTTFINLKNDSTYSNTNASSLKIKAFVHAMEKYKYRCVITSALCGSTINSQEVMLSFDEDCNVYPVNIPTGFSPNGDGVNDKLVIEGLENYRGSVVRIFNVWGDLVYEKTDYQNDWDAKANVKNVVGDGKLPAGTYYIYVDLNNGKRGKATFLIIKY